MKKVSAALVAASLVALSACGGGAEENVAANVSAADDLYNVGADDLTVDNSLDNALDSAPGNDSAADLDSNLLGNAADGNSVDSEAAGNSQ